MKTYEDGINETWNAARKIFTPVAKGGLSVEEINQIFNAGNETKALHHIFEDYTGHEAITKIKEYENGIKVGDEVINKYGWKRVVTNTHINGEITIMDSNGYFYTYQKEEVSDLKKTGQHFPEIKEVQKRMQEG